MTVIKAELSDDKRFTCTRLLTKRSLEVFPFFDDKIDCQSEYNQLIEYCNNQLITISYTLGLCVSTIIFDDYSYASKSNKFTLSDYNKIKNAHGPIPDVDPIHEKKELHEEASCSYIDNE